MASDFVKNILAGGLPLALDFGASAGDSQGNPEPERVAPSNNAGRENANPPSNFLMTVTQNQILSATAIAVGLLGLVYFVRKV